MIKNVLETSKFQPEPNRRFRVRDPVRRGSGGTWSAHNFHQFKLIECQTFVGLSLENSLSKRGWKSATSTRIVLDSLWWLDEFCIKRIRSVHLGPLWMFIVIAVLYSGCAALCLGCAVLGMCCTRDAALCLVLCRARDVKLAMKNRELNAFPVTTFLGNRLVYELAVRVVPTSGVKSEFQDKVKMRKCANWRFFTRVKRL